MNYKETSLWNSSIANINYGNDELRNLLITAFERTRENSSFLLDKIRHDFPSLTVHDINHIDGLWQVGSVIIGKDYEVNPLEAFVLGCAFLMHDAVLSYDAVGGVDKLRETTEWKDYYEDYKSYGDLTPEQKLYETDFRTIRFLHAKKAENLYHQLFSREDGSTFYIIEDESLRNHLGQTICKIAASHHWNIDEVEKLGNQIPAPAQYPVEWRINPIKLACIIRCADAGHIDAGRAPDYLLRLLSVNGVSRNHWVAQNRLSQIDIDVNDDSKVVISSNIDFTEEDFAAWNVACDAVLVLDHEIKSSNILLKKKDIPVFSAKSVSGSESRQVLSKYIKTNGWMPCDANIHISNVEGLIKNLGGEKLYGKEHKLEIVLRELIQNSRDAVVARRQREPGFDGNITVSIATVDGKTKVTVSDNGVGMSLETIKDYFLNFGSSFWASDLAKREYPGLRSSGFQSVGRFGIGFYSIFMVASDIVVESRKYDEGLDANICLKFPKGLCLRPVLSHKRASSTSVSTIVSFTIDDNEYIWKPKLEIKPGIHGVDPFTVPYSSVLSNLVASLDVDVYYKEQLGAVQNIHSDINSANFDVKQWLKDITFAPYHDGTLYVDYIDNNYQRVQKVIHNGICYGLAAINTLWQSKCSYFDVTTIGGLSNFSHRSDNGEFLGCMFAEPSTAKRDGIVSKDVRTEWAKEQYELLLKQGLTETDRIRLPYELGKYGIDMTNDMLVRFVNKRGQLLTSSLLNMVLLSKTQSLKLLFPQSDLSQTNRIENYLDYERTIKFMDQDHLVFFVESNSDFLNTATLDSVFPCNIMYCLQKAAEKLSLSLTVQIVQNKAFSRLGGKTKSIEVTVI